MAAVADTTTDDAFGDDTVAAARTGTTEAAGAEGWEISNRLVAGTAALAGASETVGSSAVTGTGVDT